MRIFLDANILFSAAKSDGAVRTLVTRLLAAGHALFADGYVVGEALRNLQAKAPGCVEALQVLLERIDVARTDLAPLATQLAPQLPEKDRPVLAAAIRLRCDVLVTGDRTHFGSLYGRQVSGVTVHSPRSLAERLLVH